MSQLQVFRHGSVVIKTVLLTNKRHLDPSHVSKVSLNAENAKRSVVQNMVGQFPVEIKLNVWNES